MNKWIGMGRLTADPKATYTNGETRHEIVTFTIAVDRRGEGADFIRCQAWDKKAEFIEKYFSKGMKILITGRIQTGSYENKDGVKVYTTDIIVENAEFCEKKGDATETPAEPNTDTSFVDVADSIAEELPFN